MLPRPTLLIVAGPTAVGKSSYSLHLARILGCPIISADSRQVYRELRIGTARLQEKEMQGITHYLLGHVGLDENYDVGKYEHEVIGLLDDLFHEYPKIILTGGTGLYLKAIIDGLDTFPDVPEKLRKRRQEEFESYGLPPLLDLLQKVDPEYFKTVDKSNPARIIRALSVYDVSGIPYSYYLTGRKQERPFQIRAGWLNLPKAILHHRINERVDQMMNDGLLDEVRSVIEYRDTQALNTVGYKELIAYLDGTTSLEEAVELIKLHTRQYAKRQVTWFRKYIPGPEIDARETELLDNYFLGAD